MYHVSIVKKPIFNFSLRVKGIILVAIPLAIQIISAFLLYSFLRNAEHEGEAFEHSREVTSEALLIAKYVYDAEFILFQYIEHEMKELPGDTSDFGKEYDAQVRKMLPHVKRLKELTSTPGEQQEIVREYIHYVNNVIRTTAEMRKSLDNRVPLEQGAFALGTVMAYSGNHLGAMSAQIDKFLVSEAQKFANNEQVQRKRAQATYLIWAFLAFDFVVVIWLLLNFNSDTINRLKILMDNTHRMAHQQQLNPALQGADEIAALDKTFHDMADAMEAAKARERELLEMKKQIMAMVSHDLRSPLTSLQFTLELLKDLQYGQLTEQGAVRVESSNQSVQRLIRMINDLLDLEKLEAGKMDVELRDIPLHAVLVRSIEAVEALASAKDILIDFDESELEVSGDGDRLIQVVVNFLSNAIKFSPEKSQVKIKCSQIEQMVELRVIDNGPGIPEEQRQVVFERYRQLEGKQKSKGTGLGLAISKLIIEVHGGSIGVDAAPGGGSAFWFRIPAAVPGTDFSDV